MFKLQKTHRGGRASSHHQNSREVPSQQLVLLTHLPPARRGRVSPLLSDGEASGSSKESGSPLQEQGHDHTVAVRKAFPADRTTVVFSQPQKIAPKEKTVFSDKQEEACAGPALVSSNSDRAYCAVLAGRQAERYGGIDDGTQPLLSSSPVPNSLWEGVRRPS